jgi:hypothetical protein
MAAFGREGDFLARRDDAGLIRIERDRVLSDRHMAFADQCGEQTKPLGFRIIDGRAAGYRLSRQV